MANNTTTNNEFEKQLWAAADKLRGSMDASEYKHVVLGLTFLKYISDKFDERYNELIVEGEGFEEDVDEHTMKGIFFVCQKRDGTESKTAPLRRRSGRLLKKSCARLKTRTKS